MHYRIGLKLGASSIGWSIIENDEAGKPVRFVDMGVRHFKCAVQNDGKPSGTDWQAARLRRRKLRRKKLRLAELRKLFADVGLIPEDRVESLCATDSADVYALRVKGLDQCLTTQEWTRVLYHIAHHRGYKPVNETEYLTQITPDYARMQPAIQENERVLFKSEYRTVGEMLFKDKRFIRDGVFVPRNKSTPYHNTTRNQTEYDACVTRTMMTNEVRRLFFEQRKYGNPYAEIGFEKAYLKIFMRQRTQAEGPGKPSRFAVSKRSQIQEQHCPIEVQCVCAPRRSGTAEVFNLMIAAAQLHILEEGVIHKLTFVQREIFISLFYRIKNVQESDVCKALGLSDETQLFFDISDEKEKMDDILQSLRPVGWYALQALTTIRLDIELQDKIITILSAGTELSQKKNELINLGLSEQEILEITQLSFWGRAQFSFRAMKKMTPFLQQGLSLNEARSAVCANTPYNGTRQLRMNAYPISTRPAVRRIVSQTLKVLRAIIVEYGDPERIAVCCPSNEILFGAAMKGLAAKQRNAAKERLKAAREIEEATGETATDELIERYLLWEEQEHMCFYSGQVVTLQQVVSNAFCAVDHILPYQDTYDDSIQNKVLVMSALSKERTGLPCVQFGGSAYRERLELISDVRKKRRLSMRVITDSQKIQFRKDNQSSSFRFVNDFVSFLRKCVDSDNQTHACKNIEVVNNEKAGLYGNRVIAPGMVGMRQAISASVAAINDEYIRKRIADYFSKGEDTFPEAWTGYRVDLYHNVRTSGELQPWHISQMPQRKVAGAAHKDFLRRIRSESVLVKRPLQLLKLGEDGEINNYYKPERDRLLYGALKAQLEKFGNDARSAFAEPFYKPKSDGSKGPLVRGVLIEEHPSLYTVVRDGAGPNECMVRLDIFYVPEEGYYMVPIYVSDTKKPCLPLRASTPTKKHSDWRIMQERNFIFSLYPGDAVYVKSKKPVFVKSTNKSHSGIMIQEGLFTFTKAVISVAGIALRSQDRQYEKTALGIKSLQVLEKWEIDILGRPHRIKHEQERQKFVK